MTREENLAWAKSLKPGDVVIHVDWHDVYALTVEKVTPTGIVKTKGNKSFAQTSWDDRLRGRGRVCGEIVPPTQELLIEAKRQLIERQDREKRIATINRAVIKMGHMPRISYEFAVDFLELCRKHEIDV